jgi:putative FmdB family regulatory protein
VQTWARPDPEQVGSSSDGLAHASSLREAGDMPLFDFECKACHHQYEAMARSGEPLPACPECKSGEVEKLLSFKSISGEGKIPSVHLKGKSRK